MTTPPPPAYYDDGPLPDLDSDLEDGEVDDDFDERSWTSTNVHFWNL
jgi:hypothetical protein